MAQTFGTFVKANDGGPDLERVAYSAVEAVRYRFAGWREKPADEAAPRRASAGGQPPAVGNATATSTRGASS